jgi:hypothetical protein
MKKSSMMESIQLLLQILLQYSHMPNVCQVLGFSSFLMK